MPKHQPQLPTFMPRFTSHFNGFWHATTAFLCAFFLLTLPLLYDVSVPEVAGDIRWYAIHFMALTGLSLTALRFFFNPPKAISLPLTALLTLALASTILLSYTDTINPVRSWFFLKHWLGYIGLFFVFLLTFKPKHIPFLLYLLLFGLLFNTSLGVIQYHNLTDTQVANYLPFWPENFVINTLQSTFLQSAIPGATFANKNLAASYAVMLLPIAAFLTFTHKNTLLKTLSALTLTLTLIFLMYSRSRASWVAGTATLIFGAAFLLLTPQWRHMALQSVKKWHTLPLLTGICFIAFTVGNIPSPINTHGLNRAASAQLATLTKFDNNEFGPRLAYNLNGKDIVTDHPFNGTGIGTFHTIYPKYHASSYTTPRHGYNVTARPQRAHNDVMQMFIEVGLLGGLLFVSLWFAALTMTYKLSRQIKPTSKDTKTFHPTLPLALFIGITGMSLNSLADFPLQMPTAPALLFIFLALLTRLYITHFPPKPYTLPLTKSPYTAFYLIASITFAFSAVHITQENLQRRAGAQHLKFAMQRIQQNVIDTTTLQHINRSYSAYPHNTRLLEHRAIAYYNFQGKPAIPRHTKYQITQDILKIDPYAANQRINLANMHLTQASQAQQLKDNAAFKTHMTAAKEQYKILQQIAGFSHFTHSIGGVIALIEGRFPAAQTLFLRALAIQPRFGMAQNGLRAIQAVQNKKK